MGRMTVKRIEATTKPGLYGDGDTLYLRVSPRGTKSWVQRVVVPDGKRHDIGLGGFPVVSLAKARRRAFDNRVSIADGRNPFLRSRPIDARRLSRYSARPPKRCMRPTNRAGAMASTRGIGSRSW